MNKASKIVFFVLVLSNSLSALSYDESELFQRVNSILDEEVIFSGPNCHNTSLRALNLIDYKRYIHEPEMKDFLMQSCLQTDSYQNVLNDVHVIYLKNLDTPFHSFIKLNSTEVLTKNGVSKRALPEVQTYEEMFKIHEKSLEIFCKVNGIKDCRVEVKTFRCNKKQSLLTDLEQTLNQITTKRESFFNKVNQEKLLELLSNVDWRTHCSSKKLSLQSIYLAIKLANMSSLGPLERSQTEELEKKMEEAYDSIDCLKLLPLTS